MHANAQELSRFGETQGLRAGRMQVQVRLSQRRTVTRNVLPLARLAKRCAASMAGVLRPKGLSLPMVASLEWVGGRQ